VIDHRHLTDDEAQLHLESGLSAPEGSRVETHLAGCPSCQALVSSFEALSEALTSMPAAEPPADFTAVVMARIDERELGRARERQATLAVLGAVAVSLVVALAFAGQAAWAPALSAVSTGAVKALHAFRITSDVLSPLISALRLQIIVVAAFVGIPLTLALSRLAAPRQGQAA
jgi:anti-sigma factor RsiW